MPELLKDLEAQKASLDGEDRLWTLREVAVFLRVSPATVRRWTNTGLLPFYRPTGKGRRLFSLRQIRAFLANCEQGGSP